MARRWLVWWAILFGAWMAFAGDVSTAEWIFGGLGAAISATFAGRHQPFQGRTGSPRRPSGSKRGPWAWLAKGALGLGRLAWMVGRDTTLVFVALYRMVVKGEEPGSSWRALPIPTGEAGPYGPLSGVLYHSFGPNRIVVDWEEGSDVVVVHELLRGPT